MFMNLVKCREQKTGIKAKGKNCLKKQ